MPTLNPSSCELNYEITNEDGTPFNANIFNFNVGTKIFSVSTSDTLLIGTYPMTIIITR